MATSPTPHIITPCASLEGSPAVTPVATDFEFLTKLAAVLCGTPYAVLSLIDADRVWYVSAFGRSVQEVVNCDAYSALCLLEGHGLHIADLRIDPRTACLPLTLAPPYYRMFCGVNLVNDTGKCVGSLCVLDVSVRTLAASTVELLAGLARQVMSLIELRAKSRALETACQHLGRLATVDELTGLLNRRALMGMLRKEIDHMRRFRTQLALVMIDIDHFKRINDKHGHLAGDVVLQEIGVLLHARLRATDGAGRYGGEELCLILPGTQANDARQLADELRLAIANSAFGTGRLKVTASFGVAVIGPEQQWTVEYLIGAADMALFHAKHQGRNRVEVAWRP